MYVRLMCFSRLRFLFLSNYCGSALRGAKAAMVLALQSPEMVTGLIPVDNAPVSSLLSSSFDDYVKGMKEVADAQVTKQSEADQILAKYEPVHALFNSLSLSLDIFILRCLLTEFLFVERNDKVTRNPSIPLDKPHPRPSNRQQDPQIPRPARHFGLKFT